MAKRPAGIYDVGYKKPPTHTQFQKGASGNPRGRPKGSRNLATLVHRVFDRKITAQQNGRARQMTVAEAMLTKIMSKAINGDAAAQRLAISLLQMAQPDAAPVPTLFESDDDRALLRAALNDLVPDAPPRKGKRKRGDGDESL